MKAMWNDTVIAQSDDTIVVEGNHYFPPDSITKSYFSESDKRTTCFWKGEAHYFDITVADERNEAAAWYYPEPKKAVQKIKDYVAFWHDVTITD